jgi:hypothetical protein
MFNPETDNRADLPRRRIGELQSGQCAVYYRDGHEGVWVKFDRTSHFPASFEPGKWKQTGQNQPLDTDEIVSVIQNIEDLTGLAFTVEIPAGKSLDKFRAEARAEYGHEIHIRATIGPAKIEGTSTVFPIKSVNDPFLTGSFNRMPSEGMVLVVGYFK